MGAALTKAVFPVPPVSYANQDGRLAHFRKSGDNGRQIVPGTERLIWLTTNTGSEIPAVYLRGHRTGKRYTFILSHGSGEDLGIALNSAKALADALNCDILCYEYTGYGISVGTPSEENLYADIQAAYDYLITDAGVDPAMILLYGRGVGTGPSVELARKRLVGGVILLGAFTSVLKTVQNVKLGPHPDMFVNIDKIGKIRSSVLLVHGKADKTVPITHSKRLYEKLWKKVNPLWIEGADHDDIEVLYRDQLLNRVADYIEKLDPPDTGFADLESNKKSAIKNLYLRNVQSRKSTLIAQKESQKIADSISSSSDTFNNPVLSDYSQSDFVPYFHSSTVQSDNLVSSVIFESIDDIVVPTDSDGDEYGSSITNKPSEISQSTIVVHNNVLTVPESTMKRVEAVQKTINKKLGDSVQPDNTFVLRCLRVRRFDVKDAAALIHRYIRMMSKLGVDGVTGVPFYTVETAFQQGIFVDPQGKDHEGAAVFVVRLNKYFPRLIKWRQAMKAMLYLLDIVVSREEELERQGVTFVVDLKGWTLKEHFSSEFLFEFFRVLQWSFPVYTKAILLLDMSAGFSVAMKTIRTILTSDFSRRIIKDVTRKTLENYIDKSGLPTFLGGLVPYDPSEFNSIEGETLHPRLRIASDHRVMTSLHRRQLELLVSQDG
eukprot:Plantae.Rhodophyta-Purpureofilum_apyrenoidigerum.ctg16834.p1 GENE.Plantae.Rhodophyta-Purpureofilum_apyrenoidigerum.ctg16834~~Plantae.Rhodophyta-Purpureofilum_apyrenoidigerum.ctg16834.p1  ORF type:complete len:661 (-),score=147.48 Plantae.Rhodophyta-Purpureofilum_apyrenoidigerum.ctg16834:1741-3723(-)